MYKYSSFMYIGASSVTSAPPLSTNLNNEIKGIHSHICTLCGTILRLVIVDCIMNTNRRQYVFSKFNFKTNTRYRFFSNKIRCRLCTSWFFSATGILPLLLFHLVFRYHKNKLLSPYIRVTER